MSYQAPFVDAATSLDPVNRENTFISYYTYGSVLGLALDLSLRNLDKGLSLDGFMQSVWQTYGKTELTYTVRDLQLVLESYAGEVFGKEFFGQYVFSSKMPDYQKLLPDFGINFQMANPKSVSIGTYLSTQNGVTVVASNPTEGSAAYRAGLAKGDRIVSLGKKPMTSETDFQKALNEFKVGESVDVVVERFGQARKAVLTMQADPSYATSLKTELSAKIQQKQQEWLGAK